ncbi:hypothetical protein PENSPDRAFT_514025 [Peniophora sp. CONT]|nr:hypothetical protein PENSPDRAFT_514025 [Peniophora sp. CONT]
MSMFSYDTKTVIRMGKHERRAHTATPRGALLHVFVELSGFGSFRFIPAHLEYLDNWAIWCGVLLICVGSRCPGIACRLAFTFR